MARLALAAHHKNPNPQPFAYNAGSELNDKTKLYETAFRGYDAYTGRFQQVDPLADLFCGLNPYHYGYNNPTNFNDPMGDDAGSSRGGYSYASTGGCGCRQDQGPQDSSTGAGEAPAPHESYGASWAQAAYGSSEAGGRYFTRYGPGDGGALHGFMSYMLHGAHEARERRPHVQAANLRWAITELNTFLNDQSTQQNYAIWNSSTSNKIGYAILGLQDEIACKDCPERGGKTYALNLTAVAGGGFTLSLGVVKDTKGNSSWFFTYGVAVGVDGGISFGGTDIVPSQYAYPDFEVDQYQGFGRNHSVGIWLANFSNGGNTKTFSNYENYEGSQYGYQYLEYDGGGAIGADVGYSFQWTNTVLFWKSD